jgi:hypothetical protein
MKYLKSFERFFSRKKSPTQKKLIVEILVDWTGAYDYNNKHYILKIGDYTNKGIITDISNDIGFSFYTTDEGKFDTENLAKKEITIFKGGKDELDTLINSRKYNL